MSCSRCGAPGVSGLCAECRLIEGNERAHGVPEDSLDEEPAEEEEAVELEVGDVVNLPEMGRWVVVEAHIYRDTPDRYQVYNHSEERELTWREHHIEAAIAGGATIERQACSGSRFESEVGP